MTTANATGTSSTLVPSFTGRTWLGLQNNSAVTVYLKFDTTGPTEATTLDGWQLKAGESLFLDGAAASNAVYGITMGAAASVTVQNY